MKTNMQDLEKPDLSLAENLTEEEIDNWLQLEVMFFNYHQCLIHGDKSVKDLKHPSRAFKIEKLILENNSSNTI